MTTFTFNPSPYAPFQFQPTLDGQVYNVVCTWNAGGQRYYFNIYDLSGNLICSLPIVGSPPAGSSAFADINLIGSYFTTSTLVYRVSSNSFEVSP